MYSKLGQCTNTFLTTVLLLMDNALVARIERCTSVLNVLIVTVVIAR